MVNDDESDKWDDIREGIDDEDVFDSYETTQRVGGELVEVEITEVSQIQLLGWVSRFPFDMDVEDKGDIDFPESEEGWESLIETYRKVVKEMTDIPNDIVQDLPSKKLAALATQCFRVASGEEPKSSVDDARFKTDEFETMVDGAVDLDEWR